MIHPWPLHCVKKGLPDTHKRTDSAQGQGGAQADSLIFLDYYNSDSYILRMYLWWSLCTLYLHACEVRVTVGDSGLCCCIVLRISSACVLIPNPFD